MPHWLIIDLEATTDEGGWPVTEMEVIEIGASLVNRQGRELDHFQRFVRPLRRPLLTPFCRQLTHITQANTQHVLPLGEVDRRRIFNLGYYTWVEQRGVELDDFEARRDQSFWRGLHAWLPAWDAQIAAFNKATGMN